MNRSCIQLCNLPDEILFFIFKKIRNVELLYSLFGIDTRLNLILQDPVFTNGLIFLKWSPEKFLNIFSSDIISNRFCLQILPAIGDKIQWLGIDSSSIKSILSATDYPNLYGLGLFNIDEETIESFFNDSKVSPKLFKSQITRVLITIDTVRKNYFSTMEYIISHIFNVFENLTHLIFTESSYQNIVALPYVCSSNTFCSSTLLVLKAKIYCFDTCLYLLDGRFNQLHTLIVESSEISSSERVKNEGHIPNLKYFSLSCNLPIYCYDQLILPCLYRMSNLETLNLSLSVEVEQRLIDGYNLKNKILNHMLRLKQFTFYIRSIIRIKNDLHLQSEEDIQNTFKDFPYSKIMCYTDHFIDKNEYQCQLFTYPSQTLYYECISNKFPGGYYPYVRIISLYDEHPFEHEFFLRITQSFPCIEKLVLTNRTRQQQNKQPYNSTNNNCPLTIVEYAQLLELDIKNVYDDYIEEFLSDRKTCFRRNIRLHVNADALLRVTQNLTRKDTQTNCTKVNDLMSSIQLWSLKSFQEYFPLVEEERNYFPTFYLR